jgi:transcriptional regulator with PAS, ATPase and Fis domain
MPSNFLVLAASSPELGQEVLAWLHHTSGPASTLRSHEEADRLLGPRTRGVLVCAAASPADTAPIRALVRRIWLRQWPVTVVLVEPNDATEEHALHALLPYVAGLLRWPQQAQALANFQAMDPGGTGDTRGFTDQEDLSLEERLARSLLTDTPSLESLTEPLALAAAHDVTVLLTGETGTGKTHLARLIHENSPRRSHHLLVIPCGALAANLIESELFGHTRGAFTGADRAKAGKFEAVGNGTLLLDEIDALSLEQQAKLLRVIETGQYEPVGSHETRRCKARIIAASNWNLEEAVEQGRFRQDLYYRLNVLALHLLPLRERPQDIGPLARGMVAHYSDKFNKELFAIAPEAMAALETFPWPGNIRQLENVIQQAVLLSSDSDLRLRHLPQPLRHVAAPPPGTASLQAAASNGSLAENVDLHERLIIERALEEANNCRSRAAHALGISRVTLYNKMKKYGIPKIRP